MDLTGSQARRLYERGGGQNWGRAPKPEPRANGAAGGKRKRQAKRGPVIDEPKAQRVKRERATASAPAKQ